MRPSLLIGAVLVAASTFAHAQAPQGDAPKARRFDCSQAKDPKACEERLAKAKEMHAKAAKACEADKGKEAEYRDCMRASCARRQRIRRNAKRRPRSARRNASGSAKRQGKTGDELRACIRRERGKT